MSVAIPIPLLQHLPDVNVSLGVGVDEYALVWDNDTARFVLRAPFAGILATGATVGATAQAQAFTLGVVSPFAAPAADDTTAWQVRKANKTTAVVTVDTTNARVGIGTAAPITSLHVVGGVYASTIVTAGNYVDAAGGFYSRSHFHILNKAASGWIAWATRNTSGAEAIVDLSAGAMTMAEMTAPTGVANKATVYARDNGSGKTMYCVKLGDDVEIILATQA